MATISRAVSRRLRTNAIFKQPTIMFINLKKHHKGQVLIWDRSVQQFENDDCFK